MVLHEVHIASVQVLVMPDRYLNVLTHHHQQEKFVCRNICKIFLFHMNKRKISLVTAQPEDTN